MIATHHETNNNAAAPSPDAVLHLLTLHLLSSAGFASTSRAASLTLSTVAAKYLCTVAANSLERAELAGRSKVGADDVVETLEDMGMALEELGGWVTDGGAQDGVVRDGMDELAGELAHKNSLPRAFIIMPQVTDPADQMQAGLDFPEGLAQLSLVPTDEIPDDYDMEYQMDRVEEGGGVLEKVDAGRQSPGENEERKPIILPEKDDSWLPPLPGTRPQPATLPSALPQVASQLEIELDNTRTGPTAGQPKQGLLEKYKTLVPYESSQLAQSNFQFPTPPSQPIQKPPPTSSLPALLKVYAATAGEPSVSLPQTPLRLQALELLRHSIAPADMFDPEPTFATPLPLPRFNQIHASASDTLPIPSMPVNPNPTGVLSKLVREIRSPYLPPALRERLTTLRPPQAQMRDGQPIYYGDPVRGPDQALLNKARGKQPSEDDPELPEEYYRYTWDVGLRGPAKFSDHNLPTRGTVLSSGVGEEVPRTKATGTIRIKLDRSPSTATSSRPEVGLPDSGSFHASSSGRQILTGDGAMQEEDVEMEPAEPQSAKSNSSTSSAAHRPTLPQLKIPSTSFTSQPTRPTSQPQRPQATDPSRPSKQSTPIIRLSSSLAPPSSAAKGSTTASPSPGGTVTKIRLSPNPIATSSNAKSLSPNPLTKGQDARSPSAGLGSIKLSANASTNGVKGQSISPAVGHGVGSPASSTSATPGIKIRLGLNKSSSAGAPPPGK